MSEAGEVACTAARDEGRWGDIGRLYQRRNDLVHGNDWEVPDQQLQQVELLARVLLTSRLLIAVPRRPQAKVPVSDGDHAF